MAAGTRRVPVVLLLLVLKFPSGHCVGNKVGSCRSRQCTVFRGAYTVFPVVTARDHVLIIRCSAGRNVHTKHSFELNILIVYEL